MRAVDLTQWQRIQLWWECEGELSLDLLTYYGVCSAIGLMQGYLIGDLIVSGIGAYF